MFENILNGIMGIMFVILAIRNLFNTPDLMRIGCAVILTIIYMNTYFRRKKGKNEPWDELTIKNYKQARDATLSFVDITLVIGGAICSFGHFEILLNYNYLLLYFGALKLVQVAAFIYYDSRIVE